MSSNETSPDDSDASLTETAEAASTEEPTSTSIPPTSTLNSPTTTSRTPTTTSTTSTSPSSPVQVPALTPPFDPAPSCTQDIYYVVHQDLSCVDSNGSTVACRQFHLGPTTSTSACFPTSWSPSSGAYISPGGCLAGYTVACAYTEESEKTATCCPSGYSCQTQSAGFPWFTTDLCVQRMPDSITYQYTTRTPGRDPETSTTTGGGTLNAFGVVVKWHASDLATATATPITSTRAPAPTPTSSSGLSTGQKAGIGAGVAIFGLLALAGAFFLWRRRRGSSQGGAPVVMYDPRLVGGYQPAKSPSELAAASDANTFASMSPMNEREGRAELSGRSLPVEIGPGRE